MLSRPGSKELIVWKTSECTVCEFLGVCPKKLSNLVACYNEDGMEEQDTTKALLIRTIRFICRKKKFERRATHTAHVKAKDSSWKGIHTTPVLYKATLYCSDIEEFKNACTSDNNRQQNTATQPT